MVVCIFFHEMTSSTKTKECLSLIIYIFSNYFPHREVARRQFPHASEQELDLLPKVVAVSVLVMLGYMFLNYSIRRINFFRVEMFTLLFQTSSKRRLCDSMRWVSKQCSNTVDCTFLTSVCSSSCRRIRKVKMLSCFGREKMSKEIWSRKMRRNC